MQAHKITKNKLILLIISSVMSEIADMDMTKKLFNIKMILKITIIKSTPKQ